MVMCKHAEIGNFRISEIELIFSNANFFTHVAFAPKIDHCALHQPPASLPPHRHHHPDLHRRNKTWVESGRERVKLQPTRIGASFLSLSKHSNHFSSKKLSPSPLVPSLKHFSRFLSHTHTHGNALCKVFTRKIEGERVFMCVYAYAYACDKWRRVCACVWERKRKRERECVSL